MTDTSLKAEKGAELTPPVSFDDEAALEQTGKSRWERTWPVLACGAGLFSDGYLNNIIGSVSTILSRLYPERYAGSSALQNVSSIAFAGTVVGQLAFGYLSDHWSRKKALMLSTVMLFVFAVLCTVSHGANGSIEGMLTMLTVMRFFLGIAIGGEYPAGSVAAAEASGELKHGHRNRWFILFTNNMIDIGFVVSSIVPMIVVLATGPGYLRAAWRIFLGIGCLPPLSLLYLRLKLKEPEEYNRQKMNKYPVWLIIKFYWSRLLVVSAIWFIYDFSAYSFGIYSSTWLSLLLPSTAPLWKTFGWNTVINCFYVPGAFAGAFISDWIGPRKALAIFVAAQGVVGFIMTAAYKQLGTSEYVGAFVVVYGIFLALGEVGPGDNIGLIASKTSATAIRGQYYGIAAACGKIGAFVGSYVFPVIQANAPNDLRAGQDPFFVSSSLCFLSAALAIFCLPHIGQDTITEEDAKFRVYLEQNGYDVGTMGTKTVEEESVAEK